MIELVVEHSHGVLVDSVWTLPFNTILKLWRDGKFHVDLEEFAPRLLDYLRDTHLLGSTTANTFRYGSHDFSLGRVGVVNCEERALKVLALCEYQVN